MKLPIPPEFLLLFIIAIIMFAPLAHVSRVIDTLLGKTIMVLFTSGIAYYYGMTSGFLAAIVFILMLHEGEEEGFLARKKRENMNKNGKDEGDDEGDEGDDDDDGDEGDEGDEGEGDEGDEGDEGEGDEGDDEGDDDDNDDDDDDEEE